MRKQNYSIEGNKRQYLLQVSEGGTGVDTQEEAIRILNGISKDEIGVPRGILGLNEEGLIASKFLPGSLGGANVVNMFGPVEVGFGETIGIEITNYDVFTTYSIVTKRVTATRVDHMIFVTGAEPALDGSIIVNGSRYPLVVKAPRDNFLGELSSSLSTPLIGERYSVAAYKFDRFLLGFPDDSRSGPNLGSVVEFSSAGLSNAQTYKHPNVIVHVAFPQNASLTITSDTETLNITTSNSYLFNSPKFLRFNGAGGQRIDTTIYTSEINSGGGPAGPASGKGPNLVSPDYSRVPTIMGQYTLTAREIETVIDSTPGSNRYTKKYDIEFRFTNTGAFSHREVFEAVGTYTAAPGYISSGPLEVMFDNQKLAWASERENGSGREIRTVEYNFTRNQMFGEHVVTNDTGTVRVYTSSRYDYAVENNGGSATIFVNGNRYTINSQDSFPYSFFGTKAIMSATGSDILISSKGTGVIRRFNVVNGVLGEKGRLAFPGSGAGTLFGTDMVGDKTLSHVAVLAPNGPSYITILKYNSISDQYVVHQIFTTLPDINMQYSIGERVEMASDGSFFLVQAKVKISDLYSRIVLMIFTRDQNGNYNYSGKYLEDIRTWSPNFNWGTDFKITSNGLKIIVGSPGNLRAPGCAHVFLFINNKWVYYKTLTAPYSALGDEFGKNISVIDTAIAMDPALNHVTVSISSVATVDNAKVLKIHSYT